MECMNPVLSDRKVRWGPPVQRPQGWSATARPVCRKPGTPWAEDAPQKKAKMGRKKEKEKEKEEPGCQECPMTRKAA